PPLALAKGEVINQIALKVVRSVVAGRAAVPLLLGEVLNSRTTVVVGEVDRLRPRVGSPEQRAAPTASDKHLHSVVSRRAVGLDTVDVCCQSELNEEWTASITSPRGPRIDVDETHLSDCACTHVAHLGRELRR